MLQSEIEPGAVHLCVDMQKMFAEQTAWRTPWMVSVLPSVVELVGLRPARTIFTRFLPPHSPDDCAGAWKTYWLKWREMTRAELDPELIELVDPLKRFVPPARVVDKRFYSPWRGSGLAALLGAKPRTLIISGAETDVCVLAATLDAVDRGYRVVIPTDAVCSSSDETHEALLGLYSGRFSNQIETTTVAEIAQAWR